VSTLTRYSAIPYTGPAPTNREPYTPVDAAKMDARGAELAAKLSVQQETGQDLPTLVVSKDRIVDVLRALKDEHKFTMPLDLFGVDYPRRRQRFDVVYQLYSIEGNERVRLKVPLGEGESLPTSLPVYKGFDWFEREAYDMFGIRFDGHPNLRRIPASTTKTATSSASPSTSAPRIRRRTARCAS
jgi:NADH:ubiquinone oxidoreductase subunit C